MSYRLRRGPGVTEALERLSVADPDGAHLIATALLALSEVPRPAGVHMLSPSEGLYRLHMDRLDLDTRRRLRYRILYRIDEGALVVLVVTVGALPPSGRRR